MAPAADTVIITGSNGFLGQALARRLMERYRVIGLDISLPKQPVEGMTSLEFDLGSEDSVKSAIAEARGVSGGPIASVIHLAAYYDITGEDHPLYQKITVDGTGRLIRALREGETGQFVFASTMLVHAPAEPGMRIDEDHPIDPPWAYPASKVAAEQVVEAERGDIPTVILRPAGIYDDDGSAAFLAQQIARIYERLPTAYLFAGDIDRGQPYLHLDDFVDAVFRVVERRQKLPRHTAFLLGETSTPTYRDMQRTLGRLIHGEDWRTLSLPKPLAQVGSWMQTEILDEDSYIKPWMTSMSEDHYELDISRAERLLGWRPKHDVMATLPDIVARLKQDPPGWYARNKLDPATVAAAAPVIEEAAEQIGQLSEARLRQADEAMERERDRTDWCHLLNMMLGAWLVASPFIHGLFDPVGQLPPPPALGHELPDPTVRNWWLGISEIVTGLLVILFSKLALDRGRGWAAWVVTVLGCWLLLAPLVFWTTNAAAYGSDTLVGMLLITFAVIIAPQPGVAREALATKGDRPLGWSYSPSSYTQRAPIVALAFVGLFVSRYLAAYQLGHIDSVWDPIFGPGTNEAANGTVAVVTSAVSKGFPIADAGFGAVAYMLDIVTGAAGDRRRWRTMPWLVLLFGMLIVPLGAVSLIFIIIQPTIIGALCTLCLIQAAVTVILIPYSIDEVLATCQYLIRARRAGLPFWRTLWRGGPALSDDMDPSPGFSQPLGSLMVEFLKGGVNFPWTLVASTAIGVLLMATPLFLGTTGDLYFSHHIMGCLVITIAVTAMAEIARAARFLNVAIGAWVVASPFLLGGAGLVDQIGAVVLGGLLVVLSLPRGERSEEDYGGWNHLIV
ncbi:NAD-dependent epimerase/dehydratase family protein [Geminicoccus harenae]|uniref:NAD-dependent epimerase/dehydratase family protein n=1 Tax=Geminicoccus harenae TaxID=2498453 RepID=UPI00168AB70D|nr:NAD-dependent epimerase/dehydratase family protein [Geminicoccus harenae]